jgi:hypothetical protein
MQKINKIDILVMKWKLFVLETKTTSGQPNQEIHYSEKKKKKKKKKKLVTKHSYSHTPDAVVVP